MRRFAISLPDHQAKAVERIRKFRNVPRSRIIQEAIERYIAQQEEQDAVQRYVEGYRRVPEDPAEGDAYMKLFAEILTPEDWS
ncbi:MAG TPA: ribbon-helix-helix protein, CopG family [bacterium]|nr:ribbon-helix-helix protein, CopG family [bacterium]